MESLFQTKNAQLLLLIVFIIGASIPTQLVATDNFELDYLLFSKFPHIIITTKPAESDISDKSIKTNTKKPWTFIVYMAADNDLGRFAIRNLSQMAAIGSNQNINIVTHVDITTASNEKITRRYYVEKNKLIQTNDSAAQCMDSGDPNTLISCCHWALSEYPAEHYAFIFWNHGTGPIDPPVGKVINPSELFTFNPFTHKLELDRTIGFLDLLSVFDSEQRGICWDDSTGHYLNNQTLDDALEFICINYLYGDKFDIIGFDACLMATIEISHIIKKYAHIMVSSQEAELGSGWDYQKALAPFERGPLTPIAFARHIVQAYEEAYIDKTDDYTQSAINLDLVSKLEENIHLVSGLLTEGLRKQKKDSIRNLLKSSCSKSLCTHFDEPSYKDLHHIYSNLLTHLKTCSLLDQQETTRLQNDLHKALTNGCALIKETVLANVTGKNLHKARGISIYCPEIKQNIHSSYRKNQFAIKNNWLSLLTHYLQPVQGFPPGRATV
jgi:hypothetical protein